MNINMKPPPPPTPLEEMLYIIQQSKDILEIFPIENQVVKK